MSDDLNQIRAAVGVYLAGVHEGDAEKLASVLSPAMTIARERDGVVKSLRRAEWFAEVTYEPSARDQGLTQNTEILMIDQCSDVAAFVMLRSERPPRYLTDYLSFEKIDGQWRVFERIATEFRV
jgi:Putative lumazine-binding